MTAKKLPPVTRGGLPGMVEWFQTRQPYLWRYVKPPKTGMAGFAADTFTLTPPTVASGSNTATGASSMQWLQSLLSAAGQVYVAKKQIDAQGQLFQTQLQRAQMGLPPLDVDPTTLGLPAPTVSVGISPDVMKWLKIGGGTLAGLLLVRTLAGHRR